jgi:hypothetical protein
VNSPQRNNENISYQYNFEVQPNNILNQSFRFLSAETLKFLIYSAPIENEKTLYQRIFMPVKAFKRAQGSLKEYDSP